MGYYNQINRLTQFPLADEGITPSLAWQFKPKGVPVWFFLFILDDFSGFEASSGVTASTGEVM